MKTIGFLASIGHLCHPRELRIAQPAHGAVEACGSHTVRTGEVIVLTLPRE